MVAGWEAALVWLGVTALAWWLWHSPRRRWVIAGRIGFVAGVVSWASVAGAFTQC